MAKKVSDILTELDITYEELKRNSEKLGIKITKTGSVEDGEANRIISTINILKGNDKKETRSQKPKIKATPISKPTLAPKKAVPKKVEKEEVPEAKA